MASPTNSLDSLSGYPNRICVNIQDDEERANAAYAEKHNLQSLFSEIAEYLIEKSPTTEAMTERYILEFLSQCTTEGNSAALRLQVSNSFEVNLYKGQKIVKVKVGHEGSTLQLEQKGHIWNLDESFEISLEEMGELVEMLNELVGAVVDGTKGEQGGFIRVDDRHVCFIPAVKDFEEAGDVFFDSALHICMRKRRK